MNPHEDIFQAFVSIWKDIADGFENIDYYQVNWGEIFSWNDLKESSDYDFNFAIVNDSKNSVSLAAAKQWLIDGSGRKLYFPNFEDKKLLDLKAQPNQLIFFREPSKISYPNLIYESVRSISYAQKRIDFDIRGMLEMLAKFVNPSQTVRPHFERFTTSLMLLQNGDLWMLEHEEGNVISMAITVPIPNGKQKNPPIIIYFLATHPELRKMGHGKMLLQTIIHKYKKHLVFARIPDIDSFKLVLEKFDFSLGSTIFVFE